MKRVLKKMFFPVMGMLLVVTPAFAININIGDEVKLGWDGSYPYDLQVNGASYDAFCVESKVQLYAPKYYVESIGNVVYAGGPGDNDYYNVSHNIGGIPFGDPLSDTTKSFYAAYEEGDFSDFTGDHLESKLQQAIWWLEEEEGGSEYYYNMLAPFVSSWSDYQAMGWEVFAVNLTTTPPNNGNNGYTGCVTDAQSQMIGVKGEVPEPATMTLFGLGLLGVAGISRRKMKK